MKKFLGIVVLGLLLSGNANAALDSKGKLTFDRCKGEKYKGLSWEINFEKSTLTLFEEAEFHRHLTIIKDSYRGNSSATVFAYTFKIATTADIEVIIRSSTGTETVKTLTTHYSVGGAGSDIGTNVGGNVTMVTAPATGETLVIGHTTTQTQSFKTVVFQERYQEDSINVNGPFISIRECCDRTEYIFNMKTGIITQIHGWTGKKTFIMCKIAPEKP